jgi:4'-phosphopantetheinyl transferase EntD
MCNRNPALAAALESLAPSGVLTGHRIIAPGDEGALVDGEACAFKQSASRVRRQSGAARIVARELLLAAGFGARPIPRTSSGPPDWPSGIVGSLAHDDEIAVAAIARADRYAGIGIDVEPALPLPLELVERVATLAERRRYAARVLESRILFAAKEAIYKAQYPRDGAFLDFQDIEVDLELNRGVTRSGRRFAISVTASPRVLALAFARNV